MKNMLVLGVAVLGVMVLCAIPVHARTPLSVLDLNGYCQSLGFERAVLVGPQVAKFAACNPKDDDGCVNTHWKCQKGQVYRTIQMNRVCQVQNNRPDVFAWPQDRDDGFSWVCYTVPPD